MSRNKGANRVKIFNKTPTVGREDSKVTARRERCANLGLGEARRTGGWRNNFLRECRHICKRKSIIVTCLTAPSVTHQAKTRVLIVGNANTVRVEPEAANITVDTFLVGFDRLSTGTTRKLDRTWVSRDITREQN